ncbi:MAG: hypothetical protein R3D68_15295 [Hyphomicrobiaceae bacterium]
MAEPHFANEDDLPRTFRREREARDREREAQLAATQAPPPYDYQEPAHGPAPEAYFAPEAPGTVTRLAIPFPHLVWFFMKAVIAAIPALILLTVVLIGLGQGLKRFMPGLRQFEIIVRTPQEPAASAATIKVVPPVTKGR